MPGARPISSPARVVPTAVAIIDPKTKRSRAPLMKRYDVAHRTSPLTRSGCRRHSSCATGPPIE
jgi:hypothetical protein